MMYELSSFILLLYKFHIERIVMGDPVFRRKEKLDN